MRESDTDDELVLSTDANRAGDGALTKEEQQQVQELRQGDAEVRRHEQAHLAAAGRYAKGGPTFTYQKGPDGQLYAIGGEVAIDTSPVPGDPEATIQKARQVFAVDCRNRSATNLLRRNKQEQIGAATGRFQLGLEVKQENAEK